MWQALVDSWRALRSEQKISVVLLGICGVLAVGLSGYRLQASVREPFLVSKTELAASKEAIGTTPDEETAKQKRTDTDGDALSDWDEVNIYHTNPNLRDTCGDGIPDNIRVFSGKNVNCATNGGQPAGLLVPGAAVSSSASGGIQSIYPQVDAGMLGGSAVPQIPAFDPSAGAGATPQASLPRDPAAIREVLQGKVDQAKLDALSDEELLQLYDEAVATQAQNQAPTTPASPTP